MSMKPYVNITSAMTDEQLAFIREMGIEYVEAYLREEETAPEALAELQARLGRYGIRVAILSCLPLQKNDVIDLNLREKDGKPADREREAERFVRMVRNAGAAGIPTVSVAWQPTGIKRSARGPGAHTRGGVSTSVDMEAVRAMPMDYPREYGEEEIWENFAWFLRRVAPACREAGVRLALHPNDPPVPSLCGVASLIWNMDGYRRAIALDPDGILGVKLCVGCWLEGGAAFGDILSDIRELQAAGRIVCVHFRNVSGTLPAFEETLSEDGYADMYAIMKQLAACGYEGPISVDHAFAGHPTVGGSLAAFAYPTGHMKGLLQAAEAELRGARSAG